MAINFKNKINIKLNLAVALSALFILTFYSDGFALPVERYASNSVLSEGKWAKVKVTETGMHFLSVAQLKNLGFTDPEKVNVFGYGGIMISENLDEKQRDDLPMLPVVRTPGGILFFGVGNTGWKLSSQKNLPMYEHIQHAYSTESYYFLSDRDVPPLSEKKAPATPGGNGEFIDIFTERLVHEQDLAPAGESGRNLLGEDFRTTNSRVFPFEMPDKADQEVVVNVRFATRTTNGSSSIEVSANGTALPSSSDDRILNASSDASAVFGGSAKRFNCTDNKVDIGIKYNPGGTLYLANLDYIELEYTRYIKLKDGEIYFHANNTTKSPYLISNCSNNTVIWDVTDVSNPTVVEYTLKGNEASFTPTEAGYREYVAFNPEAVTRAPISAGKVANQNLHALPVPDMLIVSPSKYLSESKRIADLHAEEGMLTHVLTPEEIYNEFSSGSPDLTAFRKIMKMWYDHGSQDGHEIRYCLLMSRPTYDNKLLTETMKRAGYPVVPIWQSPDPTTVHHNSSYSTDDYIGMLDDTSGDFDMEKAKIHVAVGRMPVKSLAEAKTAVDKLYKYVKEPDYGAWRNNVMIIADDQDNGEHLNQAEDVYKGMRNNGNGKNFIYERLYLDSYPLVLSGTGPSYPEARNKFSQKIAEGTNFIVYIGHANPKSWTHEGFLNWKDINSFTNSRLPFYYTATCEFCNWDGDDVSGAEIMYLNPIGGAIGFLSQSRAVYISRNGILTGKTAPHIFERDKNGKTKRIGDFYIEGKNEIVSADDNKLRYLIVGDPALKLLSPEKSVVVESINGTPVEAMSELPVLTARSQAIFSGYVSDENGNVDQSFNGTVEVTLFDAEKVIETYGNGSDGVKKIYNDRKTKLYTGLAKVTEGHWTITVLISSEIENNYSPALLNLYAYSNDGKEANGASEDFYVYGFNEDIEEDNEGPQIKRYTLNTDYFRDGGLTNSTPVVLASFTDPSGINISNAGIGHQMTLTLDGKKVFDDLSTYYTPEQDDPTSGSIAYPMPAVESGEHSLTLTVWDNVNNSSSATLNFSVAAHSGPTIYSMSTDKNPATTDVKFILLADNIESDTECTLEVFDLSGRKVWSAVGNMSAGNCNLNISWNLCDFSGHRVPRGIYLYKGTIIGKDDIKNTVTKKLAITVQ